MSMPRIPRHLKRFKQDGLTLLIDPERPAWALVNQIGEEVADLCDGRHSHEEITQDLAAKYSETPHRVATDVSSFLNILERSGLLYYENEPPVERLNMQDYVGPIASVAFELTEKCNLRCVHCFEEAGTAQKADPSTETAKSWIDRFAEVPNVVVNLTGGEFLTRPDWPILMQHLADRKLEGVILTNGVMVTDDAAATMARISQQGRFTIQVSLDGPDAAINDPVRGKGSFDLIIAGIRRLVAHGLGDHMAISFTPNRRNISHYPRMIDLAISLGVQKLHVSLLNRMGRADKVWTKLRPTSASLAQLFETIDKSSKELQGTLAFSGDYCSMVQKKIRRISMPPMLGCRIGVDLKVDINGDVYPCTPLAYDRKYCLGNLNDMTVEEIQHSPTLRELRTILGPRVEETPKCKSCAWKCFCAAGCIARAELNYGTIYHHDDLCTLAKTLYPRGFFEGAKSKGSS